MMIEKIEINNIRSYKNTTIEFSRGKNLLFGDIGAGKSSILMAIDFALFGFSNIQPDKLLRVGEKKGSVKLYFIANNKKYSIKRIIKKEKERFSQDITLDYGDYEVKYSAEEAKMEILKILGLKEFEGPRAKSVIFRYAIYIPQEEMRKIIDENGEIRLNTIRRATGIDNYRIIKQNADMIIKELENRVKILEAEIKDIDNLKIIIDNLKIELENLHEQKHEMEEENEKIKNKIEEFEKEIENLEEKYNETSERLLKMKEIKSLIDESLNQKNRIENEIDELNRKLKSLENNLKDIKKPDDNLYKEIKNKLENIEISIEKYNKNINVMREKIGKINEQSEFIENLKEDLNEYEKIYKNLEEEINEIKSRIERDLNRKIESEMEIDNEIEKLENEIKELIREKSIHETKRKNYEIIIKNGYCPTCGRTIIGEEDIYIKKIEIENLEIDKIEKLMEDKKNSINRMNNIKREFKRLENKIKDKDNIEEKIRDIRDKIKNIENKRNILKGETEGYQNLMDELDNFNKEREKLKIKKEEMENLMEKYNKNIEIKNEIEKYKSILDEKYRYIDELNEKIEKMKNGIIGYENLTKENEDIKNKIISLKKELKGWKDEYNKNVMEIGKIRGIIESKNRELNNRIDEYNEKVKINEKINYLKKVNYWFEEFYIPSIENIEEIIMEKIRRTMNERIQKYFSALISDPTKSIEIDENFSPNIMQDTYDIDVSSLSGGERSSISLAYRLALNDILRESINSLKDGLIILDEPTEGFSRDQINKFSDILDSMGLNQIIIVTHERELESIADKIIRVEKENNESRVV
ncbi:MAG: AAA family ATPase [Thermoplasmata archaeon]